MSFLFVPLLKSLLLSYFDQLQVLQSDDSLAKKEGEGVS